MKRMMFMAAAFAALVCCSKSETSQNPSAEPGTEETHAVVEYAFTEGETVTITAGASLTKVSSALNDENGVDFKWQSGDKILVSVGDKSSEFTVSKLKDEGASAEFTGRMPASGNDFDVQYPVTDPDLTEQTYSSTEAIPHDAMKFTATGCTVDKPFTLEAVNAALRLNLWGGARSVRQIVVTGPTPACTLTFETPKVVGKDKDNATPFFIVMPAGNYSFTVDVDAVKLTPSADNTVNYETYGIGTPLSSSTSFSTSTEKEFKPNEVLNMSAKSLTTVWAPVNCGYDSDHTYGLLYQWGRKYGQGYSGETPAPTTTNTKFTTVADGSTDANKDTFVYNSSVWTSASATGTDDWFTTYNPCPSGWRVPTVDEFEALISNKEWGNNTVGGVSQAGYWFNGSSAASAGTGVFLPAAGYRGCYNCNARNRGDDGVYWCSSAYDVIYACILYFGSGYADMTYDYRAYGYSVRCVQE